MVVGLIRNFRKQVARAATAADLELLLRQMAVHLEFKDAVLFELTQDHLRLKTVIDTNSRRKSLLNQIAEDEGIGPLLSRLRAITATGSPALIPSSALPPEHPYAQLWKQGLVENALVFGVEENNDVGAAFAIFGHPPESRIKLIALHHLAYDLAAQLRDIEDVQGHPKHLTARELEVLRLSANGKTSKQIALELGISPRTVNVHVDHAIAKLGAHNRISAIAKFVQSGGISPQK